MKEATVAGADHDEVDILVFGDLGDHRDRLAERDADVVGCRRLQGSHRPGDDLCTIDCFVEIEVDDGEARTARSPG